MLRLLRKRRACEVEERNQQPLASQEPPAYGSDNPGPPVYAAPSLVSVALLQQHLQVLRAFLAIEAAVRSCSRGLLGALSPDQRWSAYLRLATVRLEKWVYLLADARPTTRSWKEQVDALPDDAALVWHAWMIASPRRYEDDVRRVWWDSLTSYAGPPRTAPMWDFPLQQLAERFRDCKPTEEQLAGVVAWTETTRLPWEGLDMLVSDATVSIECPFCETEQDVPLLTPAQSGFCDVSFAQACRSPACSAADALGRTITREVLGIKRLLDDLALQPTSLPETDPGWSEAKRRQVEAKVVRRLAGGILSLTKERDAWSTRPSAYSIVSATLVQKEAARALQKYACAPRDESEGLTSLSRVEEILSRETRLPRRVILHLLSAYMTPHAFSSDIALAANWLSEFTNSLASLGWLERSWIDSLAAETLLGQSVERYTKALEIAAKVSKEGPLVVPLDIDLIWHTHLLRPSRYRMDVYNTAGRFIDHHDAIEETLASDAFDRLAKLYKKTYSEFLSPWADPRSSTSLSGVSAHFANLRTSPSTAAATAARHLPWTRPSTHSSVLVHVGKQEPRRGRRFEGDLDPPFLRTGTRSAGSLTGGDAAEDVFCLSEDAASRAGSNVLGVDEFSPATCWDWYIYYKAYRPYQFDSLLVDSVGTERKPGAASRFASIWVDRKAACKEAWQAFGRETPLCTMSLRV